MSALSAVYKLLQATLQNMKSRTRRDRDCSVKSTHRAYRASAMAVQPCNVHYLTLS
jgi:hypothetical protein